MTDEPRYAVNVSEWMTLARDKPWLAQLWQSSFTGEAVETESIRFDGVGFVVDMEPERWDACRQIVRARWRHTWQGIRLYERRSGRGWVRV